MTDLERAYREFEQAARLTELPWRQQWSSHAFLSLHGENALMLNDYADVVRQRFGGLLAAIDDRGEAEEIQARVRGVCDVLNLTRNAPDVLPNFGLALGLVHDALACTPTLSLGAEAMAVLRIVLFGMLEHPTVEIPKPMLGTLRSLLEMAGFELVPTLGEVS